MAVDLAERRRVRLAVSLGSFLAPFMVSALIVALPSIAREFELSATGTTWVGTVFFLVAGACLLPFGSAADQIGVRRIFSIGVAVYTGAALLAALAPSAIVLIGARALAGVGGAMVFGTSMAFISLVTPEAERGRALGAIIGVLMIGYSAGTLLGGLVTQYLSWRWLFAVAAVIAIIALVVVRRRVTIECDLARDRPFDRPGALIWTATLLALLTGITLLPALIGVGLALLGGLGLGLFLLRERRAPAPLLDLSLAVRPGFSIGLLTAFVYYASSFAPSFLMSLYLQDVRGLDPWAAGLVLLIGPVAMALASPLGGRLSDRHPPRTVAATGTVLTGAGIGLLVPLDSATPFVQLGAALLLLGLGPALVASPLVRVVLDAVGRESFGLASSTEETMRLAGQAISLSIAAVVFSLWFGGAPVTEATGTFLALLRLIMGVDLVLVAIALGCVLLLPADRNQRGATGS